MQYKYGIQYHICISFLDFCHSVIALLTGYHNFVMYVFLFLVLFWFVCKCSFKVINSIMCILLLICDFSTLLAPWLAKSQLLIHCCSWWWFFIFLFSTIFYCCFPSIIECIKMVCLSFFFSVSIHRRRDISWWYHVYLRTIRHHCRITMAQ
jgi:hypothetical protein